MCARTEGRLAVVEEQAEGALERGAHRAEQRQRDDQPRVAQLDDSEVDLCMRSHRAESKAKSNGAAAPGATGAARGAGGAR